MPARTIRKILIPNRGEIAVRIMRTCRDLGIATVAVFSDPDRLGLHARLADEAYPLRGSSSGETYLDQEKIFAVAARSRADAIHPGYGFLSENAGFASGCRERDLTFIGPPPEAITAMGEKTEARSRMAKAGVPIIPGTPPLKNVREAEAAAGHIGFPVLLKAAAGGGGKGMRRVDHAGDLAAAFDACRREAQAAFGDGRVFLEKYVLDPHHVEFQILADGHGNVLHLYERDCSIQRRHQKIVEETPSPLMTPDLRARMGEAAVRAARACGYINAGTIEFLVDAERNFYFLEMNTRLQVEHPITEMVTGIDLVERQIRIAEGGRLEPAAPPLRGAAVECRIYAEDPSQNFLPSPGIIKRLASPGGPGVRDDSGVYAGFRIPVEYDPMISKLVAWGENRAQAINRMVRALEEYQLTGVRTNIAFLAAILRHPEFRAGAYDTHFILKHRDALLEAGAEQSDIEALAAAAVLFWQADQTGPAISFTAKMAASPWKMAGRGENER